MRSGVVLVRETEMGNARLKNNFVISLHTWVNKWFHYFCNWIPIIWLQLHSVSGTRVIWVLTSVSQYIEVTWSRIRSFCVRWIYEITFYPNAIVSRTPVFDVSERTDYRTWCIYQDRVCFCKSSLPCSADWSSSVLMSVADVNNYLNIFRFSALFKFGLFRSPQLQSVTIINNQSQGQKRGPPYCNH